MDTSIFAFLTWQFLFFCIAIGAVVAIFRQIAEYLIANYAYAVKESKLWRDLLLPILPLMLGGIGAYFMTSYPYPEGFNGNSSRIVFGLVGGFSSSFIIRIYKAFLGEKVANLAQKVGNTIVTETTKTN